jgi:hypothetical protein
MAKLNLSNIGAMSNVVINGDFNIWQRNTTFTGPTSEFTADRWLYAHSLGTGVVDIDRSTDVPTLAQSGHESNYSLQVDCTTAEAAIAAAEYSILQYRVEGYDLCHLFNKAITVSFWVKSTKTGSYSIGFGNNASNRSYATTYIVNASDTWEKKFVTLTMDDSASYTWEQTTGRGLKLSFWLAAGSNYHAASDDTWVSSDTAASSTQVNALDNTSNYFKISQVKLELGTVPTPFINRPFNIEAQLCQRYYEKSYTITVQPGTVTYPNMVYTTSNGTTFLNTILFQVEKVAVPTVTGYSPQTGTTGKMYDFSTPGDISITSLTPGTRSIYVITNSTTDHYKYGMHWTAVSEL